MDGSQIDNINTYFYGKVHRETMLTSINVLKYYCQYRAHKPGLTHLSLVRSPGPSVVLCVHCE